MTQQAPAPGDLLISRRDADGHFDRDEIAGLDADEPLVLGGRSMGGRICSMR